MKLSGKVTTLPPVSIGSLPMFSAFCFITPIAKSLVVIAFASSLGTMVLPIASARKLTVLIAFSVTFCEDPEDSGVSGDDYKA